MNDDIKVFKDDQIHGLLIGKQQVIGAKPAPKFDLHSSSNEFTDFSKYPFPDPIEPVMHKPAADESGKKTENKTFSVESKKLAKVRRDQHLLGEIGEYLTMYETNQKRKALIMHQELEEHYLQPLSHKLASRVNGPYYDRYVKQRQRAVTAFDRQASQKDTLLKDLPKIPTISFDTSDLVDPILKFRHSIDKEKRLTKIIAEQTNTIIEDKPLPERDTMNLKKWNILAETRFYSGKDTNVSKGKRIFTGKNVDHINVELDNFAAPPPKAPSRIKRICPKDQLSFNEA